MTDLAENSAAQAHEPFRAILIAGPTASGKSALALRLAQAYGGEVINADSMQVYSGLRVITACPSAEEEAQAPHHLYRVLDPTTVCSAAMWAEMALAKIEEVAARGRVPILVGGTGLYFRALTEGLSVMPPIPDDIRQRVRQEVAEQGTLASHQRLALVDPVVAERLKPADTQRIARALEVFEATGTPLSVFQAQKPVPLLTGPMARIVLTPEREWLRDRIDLRFDLMMGEGALAEVEALALRQLDPSLPAMKALGVPSLLAHVAGDLTLEQAIEASKTQSKQFAKRQSTWFRNQMIAWKSVSAQHLESNIPEIFAFVDSFGLTRPA